MKIKNNNSKNLKVEESKVTKVNEKAKGCPPVCR
jgi:hypothetical protein